MAFLALVQVFLLNSILGKNDFGLFMMALAFFQILGSALASFFQNIILYHGARDLSGTQSLSRLSSALGLGGIGSILIAMLGGMAAWAVFHSIALSFLAMIVPAFTMLQILTGWYRGQQDIKSLAFYRDFLPAILRTFFLGLLFLDNKGHFFMVSSSYVLACFVPLLLLYARRAFPIQFNLKTLDGWDMRYGGFAMLGQLINQSNRQLAIIILGILGSAMQVADFTMAMRFGQFLLLPKNAIVSLLTPRIGQHFQKQDSQGLYIEFHGGRVLSLLFTVLGFIALYFVMPLILPLAGDYAHIMPIFTILAVASFVRAGFGDVGGYVQMAGYSAHAFCVHCLALLGLLCGIIFFVPLLGDLGGPAAVACSALIAMMGMNAIIAIKDKKYMMDWQSVLALCFLVINLCALGFALLSPVLGCVLLMLAVFLYAFTQRHALLYLIFVQDTGQKNVA